MIRQLHRFLPTVAVLVTTSGYALAHPTGDRLPAQLLEVDVARGGVIVRLTVEGPDALFREAAGVEVAAAEQVLDRLDAGVYVEVDGQRRPLRRLDRGVGTDLVSGHGTQLVATWAADAPLVGRHTIRVGNANLGDGPCWFRDEVRLPPGSVLHATNLHKVLRGKPTDYAGRWLRAESLRRVDLDLDVRDGPLVRAFTAVSPRPWTLDDARPAGPFAAWRAGREDPVTVPTGVFVAALVGLAGGLGGPGRRLGALALGAFALGTLLPVGPASAVLAITALAAVLLPAGPGLLLPAGGFAAAALLDAPWTAATASAWLAGAGFGRLVGTRPGLAAALATLGALLVALRGGG